MKYEVVNLEKQMAIGLTARTKNSAPDMVTVIGSLWTHFYQDGIYDSIHEKINNKALGIYSDYESDANGEYDITVACAVSRPDKLPPNTVIKTIPAGKYAKFILQGNLHQIIAAFWQELWTMNLDRTYICDFEEYQEVTDVENATIYVYIGIR
jgi:predicted transcriptional regulator YdeE